MNIFYQFDDKYAPYGGVSITSLFENNKDEAEVNVYILDDNANPITEKNIIKFKELAQKYNRLIEVINTVELGDLIDELDIPNYRGCKAANMRLFIDIVLPDLEGKLLYLDADTLVCGSLRELFKDNSGFGGDKTYSIGMILESQGCGIRNELGLDDANGYYNSGVILYDLGSWKQHKCSKRIIEHAKNVRAAYVSPDQDLLNVVLKDEIYTLQSRYNFQPMHAVYNDLTYRKVYNTKPYYTLDEINANVLEFVKIRKNLDQQQTNMQVQRTLILHCYRYLGKFPWTRNNQHPFSQIWDYYCDLSPWKDLDKISEKSPIPIVIETILYKILPSDMFLKLFRYVQVYVQKKENRRLEVK